MFLAALNRSGFVDEWRQGWAQNGEIVMSLQRGIGTQFQFNLPYQFEQ